VRTLFPGTPLFSWQPRASVAYKLTDKMALHAGGGVFNDIIPAQVADLGATNPPYAPVFVGGINGQVGGVGIAPGVPTALSMQPPRPTSRFRLFFNRGAHRAPDCSLARLSVRWPLTLIPFQRHVEKHRTFFNGAWVGTRIGSAWVAARDYVGTRAVEEPYQVQLNGYQTVCDGCFAPFLTTNRWTSDSAASTSSAPVRAATIAACKPAQPSNSGV